MKDKARNRMIKNGRRSLNRMRKRGVSSADPDEIKQLKVQAVAPWKRIVLFTIGVLAGVLAYIAFSNQGPIWLTISLGVFGLALCLFGAIGRKKTIDEMLQGLDAGFSNSLIESIIDGMF